MDDNELDRLLADAAKQWRVPVEPPLETIWTRVAAEAFAPPARRSPGWFTVAAAAMAALVVGAAGGRYSAHSSSAAPTAAPRTEAAQSADPNHRAMSELLGRTAVLLAALPADNARPAVDSQLTQEGVRLLTTTRLLLDSPLRSDRRLRALLQDLELVLAQVARLEPSHHRDELQFIRTALDEHDIVPRLRSAAADLSTDDL